MEKTVLEKMISDCLDIFMVNDNYLLAHNVHEQAISGALACYLKQRIPTRKEGGWDVDVEYNRNGERPKLLKDRNVKPDIIIHRRGLNNPNGNENNNLLIIEIKINPKVKNKTKDIEKIHAFIKSPPYNYKYGLFISFNTNNPDEYPYSLEWYDKV